MRVALRGLACDAWCWLLDDETMNRRLFVSQRLVTFRQLPPRHQRRRLAGTNGEHTRVHSSAGVVVSRPHYSIARSLSARRHSTAPSSPTTRRRGVARAMARATMSGDDDERATVNGRHQFERSHLHVDARRWSSSWRERLQRARAQSTGASDAADAWRQHETRAFMFCCFKHHLLQSTTPPKNC